MPDFHLADVIGFHSCDMEFGLTLLNGQDLLRPSDNSWDWLGPGSYFWEQDPARALEYATETATGKQKNKAAAKTPFVIGAIINLGNCLDLVESTALDILNEGYYIFKKSMVAVGRDMPINKGNNRALDCAVISYIHQANKEQGKLAYDSIRCAFPEGEEAFPGSMITSRLHIQICVCNPDCIKGFFYRYRSPNLIRIFSLPKSSNLQFTRYADYRLFFIRQRQFCFDALNLMPKNALRI